MISDKILQLLEWFIDNILLFGFPKGIPALYHRIKNRPAVSNSKNRSIYPVTYREVVEGECRYLLHAAVPPCVLFLAFKAFCIYANEFQNTWIKTAHYSAALCFVMAWVHSFVLRSGLRDEGDNPILVDRIELRRVLSFPRAFSLWSLLSTVMAGAVRVYSPPGFSKHRAITATASAFSQHCADAIKLIFLLAAFISFLYAWKWGFDISGSDGKRCASTGKSGS